MKISVCIPSRAQALGLWATICSCSIALGSIEHEFIVAINGRTIDDEETKLLTVSPASNVKILHSLDVQSPTEARDAAAREAAGDFICFFDDHCIPVPGWFERVIENDKDILHSGLTSVPGYRRVYHFVRKPGALINGIYVTEPGDTKTYRTYSGPAGAFAVKRSAWESIGGYGYHFEGFGGEEAFINLKAQLLGFEVWLDPGMLYYHFYAESGVRGYARVHNEDNWSAGAYILGGQAFADAEFDRPYTPTGKVDKIRQEFQKRIVVPLDKVLHEN